jgi:plasmid stabilization system protein ParE
MAKKVNWSFSAFEMLYDVLEYRSEFSEKQAEKYIEKIFSFCENFAVFPNSNPICRYQELQTKGYRCAIFDKQYIIVYRVTTIIDVLAIVHTSRSPDFFENLGI